MKLGIFGGSFDPIHNAHLIVAQLALEQLELDAVRFVVAGAQPHKQAGHGATPLERLAMVELGVDGLDGLAADRHEIDRGGPSFTVDTLRDLAREHPDAELVLLIGADAAESFESWREPDEIRRMCQVAVFGRANLAVPTGFDLAVSVPQMAISSSAIRSRAGDGRSLAGWVPPAVADYISGLRLYRSKKA